MRGVEAGEVVTATETAGESLSFVIFVMSGFMTIFLYAAAQGLGEGATDPGAVEGEIGTTPGTEEGETTPGTGAGGIAATPGITGKLSNNCF